MAASRRTARARILLARRRAALILQIRPAQAVTCPRCGQPEATITNDVDVNRLNVTGRGRMVGGGGGTSASGRSNDHRPRSAGAGRNNHDFGGLV